MPMRAVPKMVTDFVNIYIYRDMLPDEEKKFKDSQCNLSVFRFSALEYSNPVNTLLFRLQSYVLLSQFFFRISEKIG